jgi:hypothetical protein
MVLEPMPASQAKTTFFTWAAETLGILTPPQLYRS